MAGRARVGRISLSTYWRLIIQQPPLLVLQANKLGTLLEEMCGGKEPVGWNLSASGTRLTG